MPCQRREADDRVVEGWIAPDIRGSRHLPARSLQTVAATGAIHIKDVASRHREVSDAFGNRDDGDSRVTVSGSVLRTAIGQVGPVSRAELGGRRRVHRLAHHLPADHGGGLDQLSPFVVVGSDGGCDRPDRAQAKENQC